ncbi:NTP transferase domain-containing protein [Novosphingobium sp. FSY-8]|uniref:NTP transferase domain-containing protein n=1 Tax=Novosphingobium ovatum TaxID=1908523 RepID=A0ABW9XF26_9SPHN|nr:molybdenum cofactor guanylyltransferase [Novosphingobium ovatum]NBC37153.1 NTP transferase domain-containing protein [Novosphingobium ovatum]
MILGAVLAGGRSTRFGSDKAVALWQGETLLAHAVATLAPQCARVVVVGREAAPAPALCLPDWPAPGMGPLAGLCAALRHARDNGYRAVLSCAVDSVGLDDGLLTELGGAPAYVDSQPVIGLWPASAADAAQAILAADGKHSMRALAHAVEARAVTLRRHPANINTPADLAAIQNIIRETRHGL